MPRPSSCPLAFNNVSFLPDLVVETLAVSADGATVVIANREDRIVAEPFSVDGYLDPEPAPTADGGRRCKIT